MDTAVISVGLEQGPDGATLVHALSLPGCVVAGASPEEALENFPRALSEWLSVLEAIGEPVPAPEVELEVAVDDWVTTEVDVAAGASDACFEADLRPMSDAEVQAGLRRLGDLRGLLLPHVRRVRDAELDQIWCGEWTVRRALDELARAQWWTLTRLGASPLAEVPERTLGRLDTAMALVVQRFTEMRPEELGRVIEIDGEVWTPRKVMRRLLWVEWTLGRVARSALLAGAEAR